MTQMTFKQVTKEHFPLLKQYTRIIPRVHGRDHPELAQVRDIFKGMQKKVKKKGTDQIDLSAEFEELRIITDNYLVPSDGCGAYLETYKMLEEADKAYHS